MSSLASDIQTSSPIEQFVLVLKDEFDAMHDELQAMKKELALVRQSIPQPPPFRVHLEGSPFASRWFINISSRSFLGMKRFVEYLHSHKIGLDSAYMLERPWESHHNYRHVLEGFIICNKYIALPNVANIIFEWLKAENPFIFILNMERTADTVCVMYDIQVKQMEVRNAQSALVYVVEGGKLCETTKVPIIPPQSLQNHRREFPLCEI